MTDCSAEAAAILARRVLAIEARAREIGPLRDDGRVPAADALEREVRAERAAITRDYIALAAIGKGLPPGCCHGAPEPPQEATP